MTLLLLAISLAVPFAVLLWSLPRVDPQSLRPDVVVQVLFLGAGAMHGLVLAAFGTALPAAAVRDRFGLRLSLRRARRTAWAVLLGFLVGPAAGGLVLTVASSALEAWWEPVRAAMEPRALGELAGMLALVPLQLARLVNATLLAVVLCRAYRAVAPPAVAAVLEPHPTPGRDQRAA